MKLILASKNKHKLIELDAILRSLGMEVALESEYGLDIDVEETGTTFEENSYLKAKAVLDASGLPTIADDSGLMVDALGGAPGVYSARYGGKDTDEERTQLLLENMKDVPDGARGAQFVCVITCLFPDGKKITAKGIVRGEITRETAGAGGFGYDPVFYVEKFGKTFAEIPAAIKNANSHRGMALREFARKVQEGIYDDE